MLFNYASKHSEGIIKLWNEMAVRDGYKELNIDSFTRIFTGNRYFSPEHTYVMLDDKVCGFACGCTGDDLPLGTASGYITCIILSPEKQTPENFKLMLTVLEASFRAKGKRQSEILFFNPMMLPWYIPNTPRHEHNNAPGAPADTWYFSSLLENGYYERARECAMYLELKHFVLSDEIKRKEAMAHEKGYEVALYEPAKHHDLTEMLKVLDNPLWEQEITQCTLESIPVLIAAYNGRAVGFAGPVITQPSGRGYFTGIGVVPEHEGHGLGTILFNKLCEAFRNINTEYMSLYTGIKNPAIKIYEKAGFIPVREFAVMRKELLT